MVCNLTLFCDFAVYILAVPLHSINLVRSQAAPRQLEQAPLHSPCTDFGSVKLFIFKPTKYGKDLCKWRCTGSEPTAQRE